MKRTPSGRSVPKGTLNPWTYRELACSQCPATVRTKATDDPTLPRDPAQDEAGWPSHRCRGGTIRQFDTDNGPREREPTIYLPHWDESLQGFVGKAS